jgi:hypothetical protein
VVRHVHELPTRVTFDPRNKPIASTLGLAFHSRTNSRRSRHRQADRPIPGRLSETSGLDVPCVGVFAAGSADHRLGSRPTARTGALQVKNETGSQSTGGRIVVPTPNHAIAAYLDSNSDVVLDGFRVRKSPVRLGQRAHPERADPDSGSAGRDCREDRSVNDSIVQDPYADGPRFVEAVTSGGDQPIV